MPNKFYFTYGSEGHPYVGGWTVVWADDMKTACEIFCIVHPRDKDGFINCAGIYTEDEFRRTQMYIRDSNLGQGCVEFIEFKVTKMIEGGNV